MDSILGKRLVVAILGVVVLGGLFFGGGVFLFGSEVVPPWLFPGSGDGSGPQHRLDPGETPPRFVEHNVVDLAYVDRISKFRSAYGHDYSHSDPEDCRSMKHYFQLESRENRTMRAETAYYAPVEGTVVSLIYESHDPDDARMQIVTSEYPSVVFQYHHVDPGVSEGDDVEAGQQIGHVSLANPEAEIAVMQHWEDTSQQISFFEILGDDVFQQYRERGVDTRDRLVISEQYRDEHPLACEGDGGSFTGRHGVNESLESFHRWVRTTQFVDLDG